MKRGMFWAGAALTATLMCPDLMYAVTIGQVDNFEDGTTQNWVINLLGMGSPPPSTLPVNVPAGGPAGAGDNYLRLTSTGSDGAGGRLVGIQYQHQWAGNYLAAGITAIRMDVQNFGQTDLYLRLLFADPLNGPPQNEAVSITPVFLPVGSGWRSVTFPVGTSYLTPDVGSVAAALTNATEFRIYNNAGLGFLREWRVHLVWTTSPPPSFRSLLLGPCSALHWCFSWVRGCGGSKYPPKSLGSRGGSRNTPSTNCASFSRRASRLLPLHSMNVPQQAALQI